MDLREYDFSTQGDIALNGEWEFHWLELVRPGETGRSSQNYFQFPALWNGEMAGNTALTAVGYATYRLEILMPSELPPMALTVEDVYTAFELYANGELIATNGKVGRTAEESQPHWLPSTVQLPPVSEKLELTLLISNFHHSKGGARQGMVLGTVSQLVVEREYQLVFDAVLTGGMFLAGLFFLGLYRFGSHERETLYFALFCLMFSYRICGTGLYMLHSLFPKLPWLLTTKVEYITYYLLVCFFAKYTMYLYPEDSHQAVIKPLHFISLAFTAAAIVLPARIFTLTAGPFSLITLFYVFYATYVFLRAAIKRRQGSTYALLSGIAVFAVFAHNIHAYLAVYDPSRFLSFIGYIAFVFFHSLILSYRFAQTLNLAKERAESAAKAKTEFLSMMSHEIRTPLNAVIGLTNILVEDNPKESQVESLNTLKFSAENLLVIINDILDYNKIEAGKIEFEPYPVNLATLVSSVKQTLQVKALNKGISFGIDLDRELPAKVLCDPTRMSQIITNLTENAIKFTRQGSVIIRAKLTQCTSDTASVKFSVEDTGIGIPAEKLDTIFERFTQARGSTTREFGGTGLGLSITKRLLELQGVSIHVKSEEGVGTTFTFEQQFPLASTNVTSPATEVTAGNQSLAGKRVLLVEDNAVNVLVATKFLTKWGLELDYAVNGQLALDRVGQGTYDVILMDLEMPVMDGCTAARRMRSTGVTTPIIAITATATLETRDRILASGMNSFVPKPFKPSTLHSEIVRAVSGEFTSLSPAR